ncbi:MAG: hypothetical protein ABS76_07495 [Pelagibacterium sp. SCN 64-44]|nr:MAG: hypothetical protein ABS76_07495 [Pelagibacterium sp. SCN 64-44]
MESELPQWALEIVGELVIEASGTPTMEAIARALVAAERRGWDQGRHDARRAARKAFMALPEAQRANADILDEAIYQAIRQIGGEG